MRALHVARKSIWQQSRDRLGLALTLLMAPLFVVLYWGLLADGSAPLTVCMEVDTATVERLGERVPPEPGFELTACPNHDATVVVRVPDLQRAASSAAPIAIEFEGDVTQPGFGAAAQALQLAVDRHVVELRGGAPATRAVVRATGRSAALTPFDLYVPNLLIFAMIMLVFSSAMSIAREVERGTLERLRLTRMRPSEYIAGTAIAQALLGGASICITLAVAMLLGFEAAPAAMPLAAFIALLTGIACVGIGTLVASISRSVAQAFAIASFFMFLLLLFSGVVFPIPELIVLELLPTVHGARALHDVLVLEAGLPDVAVQLGALAALSAVFFGIGGWRFTRLHRTFLHEVDR